MITAEKMIKYNHDNIMNNQLENESNHDLDYINILYDEWKFRLSQYWSLTSKTVLLSFILFFIPYMKGKWGVEILNVPDQVFPIMGILFSTIIGSLSAIEMKEINAIKRSIKKYILSHSQEIANPYKCNNIVHQNLPIAIYFAQTLTGVFVLISISK